MSGRTVFVIQFRRNQKVAEHEAGAIASIVAKHGKDAVRVVSIFDDTFSWDNPAQSIAKHDIVIFGGSTEFGMADEVQDPEAKVFILERVQRLMSYILQEKIRTLGICFGHHLLAHGLGGKVERPDDQKESGTVQVFLTEAGKSHKLFIDFPEKMIALSAHVESVTQLPDDAEVLAQSEKCKIAAFSFEGHIFSVQFHPELTKEAIEGRLRLFDTSDYPFGELQETNAEFIIANTLRG